MRTETALSHICKALKDQGRDVRVDFLYHSIPDAPGIAHPRHAIVERTYSPLDPQRSIVEEKQGNPLDISYCIQDLFLPNIVKRVQIKFPGLEANPCEMFK